MRIILVGVGGTGLSSLAYIFKDIGYQYIIGVDSHASEITDQLETSGITVMIGHGQVTINIDDIVIYSDATLQSPEVQDAFKLVDQANNKKFPLVYSYFQFIGEISKLFKTIAITGTHGKSTTTAMTIYVLAQLYTKFALGITGALVPEFEQKNYLINSELIPDIRDLFDHILLGNYKYLDYQKIKYFFFVIEADEFADHFLNLDVDYALITNIELDHSDYYHNLQNYQQSFIKFASHVRVKIIGLDSENSVSIIKNQYPDLTFLGKIHKKIQLKYLIGQHNIANASLVYHLTKILPNQKRLLSVKKILHIISHFQGLRRRIEYLGHNKLGALIYSDYGHHPTELNTVYQALRTKFPNHKLFCIFQPHQARRVIEFWDQFQQVIKQFDDKIIYQIYTARENINQLVIEYQEKNLPVTSIQELGDLLAQKITGKYITNFAFIKDIITNISDNYIVIYFTAGDLDYKIRKKISFIK